MEIIYWILSSALTIVIIALGFLLKMWFKEILQKLEDLVQELKSLNETKVAHEEQIKYLQRGQNNIGARLNDHSSRIRNLELKK